VDNLWTLFAVKRAKVADLPPGIGITRNSNGIALGQEIYGRQYYHAEFRGYEMGNTPAVTLAWYRSVAVEDRQVRQWWRLTPQVVERWSRFNRL
jgi:hypothetical protein